MNQIECTDCGPRLCTGYRVRRGSVKVLLCDECAEREIRVQTREELYSPWDSTLGHAKTQRNAMRDGKKGSIFQPIGNWCG